MKKILLLCFIFCTMPALAETISAVTFNPNRLGYYQYLKVADSARLQGGLQTPQFVVNQDVKNLTQGNAWPMIAMDNQTVGNMYDVVEIDGESQSKVDMSKMIFRGGTVSGTETNTVDGSVDYFAQDDNYLWARGLDRFEMDGGSATFVGDEGSWANKVTFSLPSVDSPSYRVISHLIYGSRIRVEQSLKITGHNPANSAMNLYGSTTPTTQGFKLAGVDIPYKTSQPNLASTKCNFQWRQFETTDSKKYYILVAIGQGC